MKYYEKIDGLRFIAIFFVLVEHFMFFIGEHISAGYFGVDLFFVISGFLITSILLAPRAGSFQTRYFQFLGRRTLRIFPIYYLTVLILWVLQLPVVNENIFWLLTYTFNYASVFKNLPLSPVTHFWSLSVEEQFYLLWPLIVLALRNSPRILLCILILIISFGFLQMMFSIMASLAPYNDGGLLTRMASLGLGALGALALDRHWLPEQFFNNKFVEYCIFLLLATSLILDFQFKPLVLAVCSLFIILKSTNFSFHFKLFDNFISNTKVRKLGMLAYGIYIFHLPVKYYLSFILDPLWKQIDFSVLGRFEMLRWHSWILKFPLYSAVSIALAALSYKYIEMPILKLKDRWFQY